MYYVGGASVVIPNPTFTTNPVCDVTKSAVLISQNNEVYSYDGNTLTVPSVITPQAGSYDLTWKLQAGDLVQTFNFRLSVIDCSQP